MGAFCVIVLFSSSLRNLRRFHFHQVLFSCPMIFIFSFSFRNKLSFKKFRTALYSKKSHMGETRTEKPKPNPKETKARPCSQLVTMPGMGRWLWPVVPQRRFPTSPMLRAVGAAHPRSLHNICTRICHSSHEQQSSPRQDLGWHCIYRKM